MPVDIQDFDACLDQCVQHNDAFTHVFYTIVERNYPVDLITSKGRTALGIAAEKGLLNEIMTLLKLNANPFLKDGHGRIPLDYAEANNHKSCSEALTHHGNIIKLREMTLNAYQSTKQRNDGNEIDHNFILHMIEYIHTRNPSNESILVFLPGYDDIMRQHAIVEERLEIQNYKLFVLHSAMNGCGVFDRMPPGIRKIILSTNIAETSVTIDDVVSSTVKRTNCAVFALL